MRLIITVAPPRPPYRKGGATLRPVDSGPLDPPAGALEAGTVDPSSDRWTHVDCLPLTLQVDVRRVRAWPVVAATTVLQSGRMTAGSSTLSSPGLSSKIHVT